MFIFLAGEYSAAAGYYIEAVIKRHAANGIYKYARSRAAVVLNYIYFVAESFWRIVKHKNSFVSNSA